VARRLDQYPVGTPIPEHLVAKAARALEAPPDELVRRGVITSGDVLAAVLPQLTSRLMAAGISDPVLAGLYEQAYAAFRRRRGLLLLNLEHQVRFGELPWVTALQPCRSPQPSGSAAARRALEQAVMLAVTAFPHALLPNPLVRELAALAGQAEIPLPLTEEAAADIFIGAFTVKWREAAADASRPASWERPAPGPGSAPPSTAWRTSSPAADSPRTGRSRAAPAAGSSAGRAARTGTSSNPHGAPCDNTRREPHV
jgi:hypothetical protein